MKRIIIALAVCLTVLAGCGNGKLSGETETVVIGVPCTFSTLNIKGYAHFVTSDDANTVTVTADRKLVKLVKVKGKKNKLSIDTGNKKIKSFGNEAVQITLPHSLNLGTIKMDGSSTIEFKEILMDSNLKFNTKGSNHITGVLTFENIVIKSEGADIYDVNVNGDSMKLTANGSSCFGTEAVPLMTGDMYLDLKGSCVAYIDVPGRCTGTIDGDCEVYAHGDNNYQRIKTLAAAKVLKY